MVVRIKSPHSIIRALNYNERKVQQKKAECIHAENYLLPAAAMTFHAKKERLTDLISRNERTKKTNTLHISVNFDPAEKLSNTELTKIAQSYMAKIGFANQPYLVYVHHDAGHPHIHILTTNIQPDGKRIDTYNIGRNQSEIARKAIELEFGLKKAQHSSRNIDQQPRPVDIQRVQYGKSETRRSIANVLDAVIDRFKYTSLAELNAVLKQYNVTASRGMENGIIYKTGGLIYSVLDEKGQRTGVSIKASLLHNKPTLKSLEQKFTENEMRRMPDKKKIKASIDWAISKSPVSLEALLELLRKDNIHTVLRRNSDDLVYGITFIDFRSGAVFNGSDIGKVYSIAGLNDQLKSQNQIPGNESVHPKPQAIQPATPDKRAAEISKTDGSHESLAEELMAHDKNLNRIASELLKKKRKKRNKNL